MLRMFKLLKQLEIKKQLLNSRNKFIAKCCGVLTFVRKHYPNFILFISRSAFSVLSFKNKYNQSNINIFNPNPQNIFLESKEKTNLCLCSACMNSNSGLSIKDTLSINSFSVCITEYPTNTSFVCYFSDYLTSLIYFFPLKILFFRT